jgi:nucleotide-binding universal stress UspA family protein
LLVILAYFYPLPGRNILHFLWVKVNLLEKRGREHYLKISHILVPTDFSPFSDLAIQNAAFFCKVFDAQLTLAHVLTLSEVNALTSEPGNPWENVIQAIQNNMQQEYNKNSSECQLGKNPILEVLVGEPAEEIVKFAEENQVDLIIMGTHGRTGLASIFLGSVTVDVIKKSCIPVTVIKCLSALH